MAQSVAVILSRLTQSLYDIRAKYFINTAIVKYQSSVSDQYGYFSKALLSWYSQDKDGTNIISNSGQILLYKHTRTADYSSCYELSDANLQRFLSDCSKFKLQLSDFSVQTPNGIQIYYVFGNNNLRVLIHHQYDHGVIESLSFRLIRSQSGLVATNQGINLSTQFIIGQHGDSELGVCKNKFCCGH